MIILINKSSSLTRITAMAYAGAIFLTLAVPIAIWSRLGLATVLAVSFGLEMRNAGWRKTCTLHLREDGSCSRLTARTRRRYRVAQAVAWPGALRLVLTRPDARPCVLLIPRDAVAPGTYRNLRAQIIQQRLPKPESPAI